MLSSIVNYINQGSLYYSLEISEQYNKIYYNLCELKMKRKELFISNSISLTDLKDISKNIKRNAPLILIINTSDVLTKIVSLSQNKTAESIVQEQFPNLDFNVFYYSLTQNQNGNISSIINKEKLNFYLNQITILKLQVCKIELGISAIINITNYIKSNSLYISNSKIEFENNFISKITPKTIDEIHKISSYEINNLELTSNSILGFSSILSYISKSNIGVNNFNEIELIQRTNFKNNRFFYLLLKTSLISMLTLLFVNFLVFNYYFEKVNSLQIISSFNKSNKKLLLDLKEEVQNKEQRVEAIQLSSNSKSTYFIDEIGASIPNTMSLSELKFQPLTKPLREGKQIEIDQNIIIISGISKSSQDFSEWTQTIEKLKWVEQTQTLDYDYENTTSSKFSIKLTIYEK